MAMIEIKNLTKTYGEKVVFKNFNLNIEENKITAILGESGVGKTTLLNCICNLTEYEGNIINKDKKIGYVFQTDRLIKNLTVKENLELVAQNIDVTSALDKVGLNGTENLYPKELSFGMKKRISLLRAYLYNPEVLVMDEPFTNLDLKNKKGLIDLIKSWQNQKKNTVILVTHDVFEAVNVADTIVLLKENGNTIVCKNDQILMEENYKKLVKELIDN